MDLHEKDRGNISLFPRLQPLDFDETKLTDVIVNTQICFYDLKIAETDRRIQRLKERNKELEDNLKEIDLSTKILHEKETQEINGLTSQIVFQLAKIKEQKEQLAAVENSRIEREFAHIAKAEDISKKYKNTRTMLISQIKHLSAKMNVLEDYKSMQHTLERKLDAQNYLLSCEGEQIIMDLQQIEHKFQIDKDKFKKELYKRLLDLAAIFQSEIVQYISSPIRKLLSENIFIHNKLSTITETVALKKQNYIQCRNSVKIYRRNIKMAQLNAKKSIIIAKLEKCIIAVLRELRNTLDVDLSILQKSTYLTDEKYILKKDNANNERQKCETRVNHLEVSLYREKNKFVVIENQKQWIFDQLQIHLQMLYDIKYLLMNLISE